jgi:hypothetical protein
MRTRSASESPSAKALCFETTAWKDITRFEIPGRLLFPLSMRHNRRSVKSRSRHGVSCLVSLVP